MSQAVSSHPVAAPGQARAPRYLWLVVGIAVVAGLALALTRVAPVGRADLAVEGAWARPAMGGQMTSAIYMTIQNPTASADRLVAVETTAARVTEPHRTTMENGMMRMQPVEAIDIPARGEVVLKPGGYHIMLFDLQTDLQPGATIPVTLRFAGAGAVTLDVSVRQP